MRISKQLMLCGATSVALMSALGGSILMSLPSSVLLPRDTSPVREVMSMLLPESWPFFTKPPSDSEVIAYQVVEGRVASASGFPNSRAENWYGILRGQRAQGPEMANMINLAPQERWTACSDSRDRDCLLEAHAATPVQIYNDFPIQSLCGDVIIAETAPVPFSYRDLYQGWRMDKRALHLDVRC